MTDQAHTVGGVARRERIDQLRLDWRNPRLPPDQQRPDADQLDLARYIDKRYNPLEVAQSIARHGFFESEPLIAVEEGDALVVVEGNRRLTALLGLSVPRFREALSQQTRGWSQIELAVPLPELLPIVVVGERAAITPLLGFRHISGIKEWEPFAQARYIVDLVEEEEYTLDEVAELVGRPHLEVKAMYRDHEIVRQAAEVFSIDTARVTQDFGVFNAAMNIRNIRVYIGAPTRGSVTTTEWPLPPDAEDELKRLLVYMYGDSRGRGRALSDSRQLRDLGRVLADQTGRAVDVLDQTHDIAEAVEALTEPAELALKRLNASLSALVRVQEEGPEWLDSQSSTVLAEIKRIVEALAMRALVDSKEGEV